MQRGVLLVQTAPVPGREPDFDHWYNTVHVPQILQTPGFVAGTRFRAVTAPGASPLGADDWRPYLALYEIAAPDLAASHAALLDRMRAGELASSDVISTGLPYRSQLFEQIFRARA
jgi:hypothetical protein